MKKYILAIALIAVVATTVNLSLKKTNINPEDLVAAAVARPEVKTQAPTDVKAGGAETQKGDQSGLQQPDEVVRGCLKKQACTYVGDEAVKKGAKQDSLCTYQAYLAKVNPGSKRLDDVKKVIWPTKPELDNVIFCEEGDKDCVPLYEMQVYEEYKGPAYTSVYRINTVHKIVGNVPKADLAKYDGAKACNWDANSELGENGDLIKTLKVFEKDKDVTNKHNGGPNSKNRENLLRRNSER